MLDIPLLFNFSKINSFENISVNIIYNFYIHFHQRRLTFSFNLLFVFF